MCIYMGLTAFFILGLLSIISGQNGVYQIYEESVNPNSFGEQGFFNSSKIANVTANETEDELDNEMEIENVNDTIQTMGILPMIQIIKRKSGTHDYKPVNVTEI